MRLASLLAFASLTAGSCQDQGIQAVNAPPEANILSHQEGAEIEEGTQVGLRGAVSDPDHPAEDLSVSWYLGTELVCGPQAPDAYGDTSCDAVVSLGDDSITLEVQDPQGKGDSDVVTIEVLATEAPEVQILAPEDGESFYEDRLVTFEGWVGDEEDEPDTLIVWWESSVSGELEVEAEPDSTGTVLGYGTLEQGEQALELHVEDSSGKTATASVTVTVGPPNNEPSCAITAPESGGAGQEGEEVVFEGLVDDEDEGPEALTVGWSSDIEGDLGDSNADSDGLVALATGDLEVGTHVITLTATDEAGASCSDAVLYTVGNPPNISITAPSSGDVFNEGDLVTFSASVSDPEDSPDDLSLSWDSDLDGTLNTDPADSAGAVGFTSSVLGSGTHTVTLTATDSDGLYSAAMVDLTVNALPTAPTVTLSPDPALTSDDLAANASGSTDPEGGTVSYGYVWYEDGTPSGASSSSVFPASATTKGRTYRVVVTPSDGTGDGPTGEASVTVDNSDPTLSSMSISPSTGVTTSSTLVCSATASDDDGDTPSVGYAWSSGGSGLGTGATITLDPGDVAPGDTVTCTATATDDEGATASDSASVSVENTDPVVDSVAITPSTGVTTSSTLTCSASASDDDGGTPTISYGWSVGGSSLGSGSSLVLTPSTVSPGDTVACTATATDTDGGSDDDSASVTVENTDPTVDSVSISPSSGVTTSSTLTCSASASDDDGGSPSIGYAWSGTGGSLGTGSSLTLTPSTVSPGDTVTCTATATDSDGGSASGSDTVSVENSDPTVSSVTISPSSGVGTASTLTCSASASDPDGGTPTLTYAWTSGGSSLGSGAGLTLSSGTVTPGDTVTCTATATDADGGSDSDSASVTVGNSDPTVDSVGISPSSGITTSTALTCSATASDDDGGTPTISYAWSTASGSLGTGSALTLTSSSVSPGDTVTCTATATDSDGGSGSDSASVTVDNTDPVLGTVSISPSSGVTTSTALTCSASATDADGGTPTLSYAWTNGSSTIGTAASVTLDPSTCSPGDSIACTVTATDSDLGTDSGSATVLVQNSAPSITSVTISPASPLVSDTLTCSHAGYSDPDGDGDASTYAWTVGSVSSGTGSTLAGAFSKSDTVTCTVTPHDGSSAGTAMADSVTIGNTAPEVSSVSLSPSLVYTDDTVSASVSTNDDDGDSVTLSYAWYVDGGLVSSTGSSLSGVSWFDKHQSVYVVVTPTDGTDSGSALSSSSVSVLNTAPTAPVVSIDPSDPRAGLDDLLCQVDTASTDADGDSITYTVSWDVDGVDYLAGGSDTGDTGAPWVGAYTTSWTDDSVPAEDTVAGETWTCTATPDDGEDDGSTASASVTIDTLEEEICTLEVTTTSSDTSTNCTYTPTEAGVIRVTMDNPDASLDGIFQVGSSTTGYVYLATALREWMYRGPQTEGWTSRDAEFNVDASMGTLTLDVNYTNEGGSEYTGTDTVTLEFVPGITLTTSGATYIASNSVCATCTTATNASATIPVGGRLLVYATSCGGGGGGQAVYADTDSDDTNDGHTKLATGNSHLCNNPLQSHSIDAGSYDFSLVNEDDYWGDNTGTRGFELYYHVR